MRTLACLTCVGALALLFACGPSLSGSCDNLCRRITDCKLSTATKQACIEACGAQMGATQKGCQSAFADLASCWSKAGCAELDARLLTATCSIEARAHLTECAGEPALTLP